MPTQAQATPYLNPKAFPDLDLNLNFSADPAPNPTSASSQFRHSEDASWEDRLFLLSLFLLFGEETQDNRSLL